MKDTREAWEWLQTKPSLAALCAAYPAVWTSVEAELAPVLAQNQAGQIKKLARQAAAQSQPHRLRITGQTGGRVAEAALLQIVRARMIDLAIRQYSLAQATGVKAGKVRFDWFNGLIAQRLFFAKGLQRKPVSLFWFRLLWPLLWQKRRLMPLVESRGIYCFYAAPLIAQLKQLIAGRTCHEIAAGDGTLARLLQQAGVAMSASDDASWSKAISYPANVQKMDARDALQRFNPQVVICCWPPSGNPFERQIFRSRSVETYLLITSRDEYVAGNWDDYRQQTAFDMRELAHLRRLILPPALNGTVYLFQRKPARD